MARSEQEILNALYSVSGMEMAQSDASKLRISALGVNITDVTNTDAGDFRTSSIIDSGSVSAIITDGTNKAEVDYSGGLVNIPLEHYKCHEGSVYGVHFVSAVANATSAHILLRTKSTGETHAQFFCNSAGLGFITLYEDVSVSAVSSGASLETINLKRIGTLDSCGLSAYRDASISATSSGKVLFETYIPAAGLNRTVGGVFYLRDNTEVVLSGGKDYLLAFYNDSGNPCNFGLGVSFYEI